MPLPTNRTESSTVDEHELDHNTLHDFFNDWEAILPTQVKGFVNHGATASTARPAGFVSVEWFGSVEPTNAINGDTWVNTSA